MKIKQTFVELDYHRESFKSKYNLIDYYSENDPAVFFSSGRGVVERMLKHKGFGVCIWVGRDMLQLLSKPKLQQQLKERKNLHHISTASFISPFFYFLNIPYVEIPLVIFSTNEIEPKPKGEKVFAYVDKSNPRKFNTHLVEYIKHNIPYELEICNLNTYTRLKLLNLYEECFVGVKLAEYEGFSNCIAELGFMGRRCISRVNSPNAIYWYTVDDVISNIHAEYDRKCRDDDYLDISGQMKFHLQYRDNFLNTEFWENLII